MNEKPIVPSQGNILQDLTLRSKLMLRLMGDKRVSLLAKIVPLGALAYLLSPVDLAPGMVFPVVGALDDVAIVSMGIYFFIEMCPTEVVRQHIRELVSNNSVIQEEAQKASPPEEEIVDAEAHDI